MNDRLWTTGLGDPSGGLAAVDDEGVSHFNISCPRASAASGRAKQGGASTAQASLPDFSGIDGAHNRQLVAQWCDAALGVAGRRLWNGQAAVFESGHRAYHCLRYLPPWSVARRGRWLLRHGRSPPDRSGRCGRSCSSSRRWSGPLSANPARNGGRPRAVTKLSRAVCAYAASTLEQTIGSTFSSRATPGRAWRWSQRGFGCS